MNKLKIHKETLIKLDDKKSEQVNGGRTGANCTDSCILTNKYVMCCY